MPTIFQLAPEPGPPRRHAALADLVEYGFVILECEDDARRVARLARDVDLPVRGVETIGGGRLWQLRLVRSDASVLRIDRSTEPAVSGGM